MNKEQEGDAVGFAEWVSKNQWKRNPYNQLWYDEIHDPVTTKQLYQLYLERNYE